jgi:hypothetical protein
MATFASWLSEQTDRDDAVGYVAKYWKSVTPGKISAVSGIERYLAKIRDNYAMQPEDMAEPAWRHAQAQADAAISGLPFAVDAYHKHQAIGVAEANGVTPADLAGTSTGEVVALALSVPGEPDRLPDVPNSPAAEEWAKAKQEPIAPPPRGEPRKGGKYTGWPEDRFNRIEAHLEHLIAQNAAVIETLQAMVELFAPDPVIDWDELAAMADYSAEAE